MIDVTDGFNCFDVADIVSIVVDDTDNFHKPLVVVDENNILDCVYPYKDTAANIAVDASVDVNEDVKDDDAVDVHIDNYVNRQDAEDFDLNEYFDFVYSFQLFKNLLYFIMAFRE